VNGKSQTVQLLVLMMALALCPPAEAQIFGPQKNPTWGETKQRIREETALEAEEKEKAELEKKKKAKKEAREKKDAEAQQERDRLKAELKTMRQAAVDEWKTEQHMMTDGEIGVQIKGEEFMQETGGIMSESGEFMRESKQFMKEASEAMKADEYMREASELMDNSARGSAEKKTKKQNVDPRKK